MQGMDVDPYFRIRIYGDYDELEGMVLMLASYMMIA